MNGLQIFWCMIAEWTEMLFIRWYLNFKREERAKTGKPYKGVNLYRACYF